MGNLMKHPAGNFCWIELGTTSQSGAKEFYTQLFGWQFNDVPMGEEMGDYTLFSIDGKEVAAMYQLNEQQHQGVPPHWMPYVSVENADEMSAKVEKLGGTVLMPPFDVFTHGRMFMFKDPTGATLSVWQPKEHYGIDLAGSPGTMCWGELATPDPDRAKKFFAELFGWSYKFSESADNYIEIVNGDQPIGGILPMTGDQWKGIPPHWTTYFNVNNCDETVQRAEKLGAKVCVPPTDIPKAGRFSVINDPQGAVFSVIHLTFQS
ncbi:MAG TPA: VOC family protein [Blastocatellia bacterium]|nr:VOC family protein [Blastocatellia bacterium]